MQPRKVSRKRRHRDPAAVELGRKGGLKGGKARAASLIPEQRSEIAKKAAAKRWGEVLGIAAGRGKKSTVKPLTSGHLGTTRNEAVPAMLG